MRLIDADALISEVEKRIKPKIIQIAGGLGYSFYKWFIELIKEQVQEKVRAGDESNRNNN